MRSSILQSVQVIVGRILSAEIDEKFDEVGTKWIRVNAVYLGKLSTDNITVPGVKALNEEGKEYKVPVTVFQVAIQDQGTKKIQVVNILGQNDFDVQTLENPKHELQISGSSIKDMPLEKALARIDEIQKQTGKPLQLRFHFGVLSDQGINDLKQWLNNPDDPLITVMKERVSITVVFQQKNLELANAIQSGALDNGAITIGPVIRIDLNTP